MIWSKGSMHRLCYFGRFSGGMTNISFIKLDCPYSAEAMAAQVPVSYHLSKCAYIAQQACQSEFESHLSSLSFSIQA
jgi:hypothetical protein